jgi:hypothetical protein
MLHIIMQMSFIDVLQIYSMLQNIPLGHPFSDSLHHEIHINTEGAAATAHRMQAALVSTPLVPVVLPLGSKANANANANANPSSNAETVGSPTAPPPTNIHLLSLDRVGVETTVGKDATRILLRLHHVFQAGETGDALSADTTIDLTTLLPAKLSMTGVVELPLNGVGTPTQVPDLTQIVMLPLSIRTFEITLSKKK